MLRHALILILMLFSNVVFADDDEIYVAKEKDQYSTEKESIFDGNFENFGLQLNLASFHPGGSDDFNQFNRGLGIEYYFDSFFLTAGYFWNSLYRDSFYAGVGKEIPFGRLKWVGVGAIAGLITGYDDGQEPRLAAVPYLFFTKNQYTLKIHYLPELGDVEQDSFGFAIRYKFE